MRKLISLKGLRKKAWKVFSEWIRRSEKGICFTCGKQDDWKNTNAGHWIHRNALDFNVLNIHCQCIRCNQYLSGNLDVYTLKMIDLYGRQTVEDLQAMKNVIRKWHRVELEDIVELYSHKIKELEDSN